MNRFLPVLLLYAAAGCANAVSRDVSVSVVDAELDAVFDWSVAGADSVSSVSDAVPFEGGLFIADHLQHRLWWLDGSGNLVTALGRPGRGPGEFRRLRRVGLLRDTLWTWDTSQSRIEYWHLGDGSIAYSHSELVPVNDEVIGLLERARLEQANYPSCVISDREPDRPLPDCTWVLRKGDVTQEVARSPTGFGRIINLGNRETVSFQPFPATTVLAVAPDGSALARLDRAPADLGPGGVRIVLYGGDGVERDRFIVTGQTLRLSRGLIREAIEEGKPTFSLRIRRLDNLDRRLESAIDRPDYVPGFTDIRISVNGEIWLKEHPAFTGEHRWVLLDSRGQPSMAVRFPKRVEVLSFTENGAWTRRFTELRLPVVERYGF